MEGPLSESTNNLEKAYEDLEREIMEIKQKLQSSAALSSSGTNQTALMNQSQNNRGPYLRHSTGSGNTNIETRQRMAASHGIGHSTGGLRQHESSSPARTLGGP